MSPQLSSPPAILLLRGSDSHIRLLPTGTRRNTGTRVALGVGLGLLISDRLNEDQWRAAGWALFGVGVMTTIPIVRGLLAKPPLHGD